VPVFLPAVFQLEVLLAAAAWSTRQTDMRVWNGGILATDREAFVSTSVRVTTQRRAQTRRSLLSEVLALPPAPFPGLSVGMRGHQFRVSRLSTDKQATEQGADSASESSKRSFCRRVGRG
jgi:hypothetical protein